MNTKQIAIAAGDIPALTACLRSAFLGNIDKIPSALKEKKAWLIWKVTKIDSVRGKFDKIPHYPRTKQKRSGAQGMRPDISRLGSCLQSLHIHQLSPEEFRVGDYALSFPCEIRFS